MTPDQIQTNIKRTLMPMTQHWHIQRGFKDCFDAVFKPFVVTTEIIAAATKVAADALQQKVFFNEARKCK